MERLRLTGRSDVSNGREVDGSNPAPFQAADASLGKTLDVIGCWLVVGGAIFDWLPGFCVSVCPLQGS